MSQTCNLRDCGKCGKSPRKCLKSLWRAVCGKCGKSSRKSLIFGGMWCGKWCGKWPPIPPYTSRTPLEAGAGGINGLGRKEKRKMLGAFARPPEAEPWFLVPGFARPPLAALGTGS